MTDRLIAIGDIHGCSAALRTLLEAIAPQPHDTIVMLGDYIDRGPDSRGVLDLLRGLARQTWLVPLLGNHDEMMLDVCRGRRDLLIEWLLFGGQATLDSYDVPVPEAIPLEHLDFLRRCQLYYETATHFFVHGNYLESVPLAQQPAETVLWESIKQRRPGPHVSGKIAIVGHSSQKSGQILDLGYLKCIDTWCYGDGWLTALDVGSGQVWQANKMGAIR
jgi:serine/threonine protein phosphatase 1